MTKIIEIVGKFEFRIFNAAGIGSADLGPTT